MAKLKQYVEITAVCNAHGRFTVKRKPNRNEAAVSGGMPAAMVGLYQAVKCPKCPWWATILVQKMVDSEGTDGTNGTDGQTTFFADREGTWKAQ